VQQGDRPQPRSASLPLACVQELMLKCQQLAAAAGCNLTVYLNNTNGGFRVDPSSWGVPSAALPGSDAASLPRAEALNLTYDNVTFQPLLYFHGDPGCNVLLSAPKVVRVQLPNPYYSTSPPPGRNVSSQVGPSCRRCCCKAYCPFTQAGVNVTAHALLLSHTPRLLALPVAQVLVFGVGLNATLSGGVIVHNSAHSIVRVLANSTLHVSGSNVTHNNVTRGAVRCSQSAALKVTNTVFVGNHANDGGGVAATDCRADVHNSTYTHNNAVDAIGQVHLNQRGSGGACLFANTTAKTKYSPTAAGHHPCAQAHC
jgi:hypothetical protein